MDKESYWRIKMNEELEKTKEERFPWIALGVYSAVLITTLIIEFYLTGEFETVEDTGVLVTSIIFGIIAFLIYGLISTSVQYLLVKFPTQWISKEKDIYTNEIWSAIFYSTSIGIILNLIVDLLNYQGNIFVVSVVSLIIVSLFLFFYFSGEEKEVHIKKAITTVNMGWFLLGTLLNIVTLLLPADIFS